MRAQTLATRALIVAGAWLPFYLFWVLFFMTYGRETQTLPDAMAYGLVAIGSAAVLGAAVWRFCARNPWPLSVRGAFYAKHLLAASAYAILWILAMYSGDAALDGKPVLEFLTQGAKTGVIGWQFLMGVWLYGLVAGVAYGIQTRRRANESERRAMRAESALTAARLEALRSRLNPHFLFNALHTVGALVRQDPALAENAVERLGDILRQTLRDDVGETVSFREEWELTERYLEFEQLRYGDRLAVSQDVDPRAFDCRTPTFALQTLVENAVRHSIANRVEGGRVAITARVSDGTLHLRVRDDGPGRSTAPEGHGYGLRALGQRLEAVYGSSAALTVTAETPDGYEATLQVPCEPPRDAGADSDDS
jgi:signal transduction histidine kinase